MDALQLDILTGERIILSTKYLNAQDLATLRQAVASQPERLGKVIWWP